MSTVIDEALALLNNLSPEKRREVAKEVHASTAKLKWVPNPGPQTDAYFSPADVLLYGGEPGGGKTNLLLGLAFNCHQRSLLMRRKYADLDRIIEDMLKINGTREGYNGSPPPTLRISDTHRIDLGAANQIGDEQGKMGQGHDALLIDEATHFAESQIRFLMGWVRTEDPKQRTRTVLATNPPLTAEGLWVTQMFAPWLDPTFVNPAKPGELRWVVSDENGNDKWVNGPGEVLVGSKMMRPKSRTYIPASVQDNPYYAATDYERELDAMPEPYRSILRGGFKTSFKDMPNQVIPTAWILEAQKRWRPKPPDEVPMCSMGVDASGGGEDPMVIATRYDGWYAPLVKIPGKDIPMERCGAYCAGLIISYRKDGAQVTIDLGGGYGGSTYEALKSNQIETKGFKGAESTTKRSTAGKFKFVNKRSAAYWLFREALDPGQPDGSPIALPPDQRLVADLAAAAFEVTPNGIRVESKDKVCERLGRSTDEGDAVVMAWFEGPKEVTDALQWLDERESRASKRGHFKVITGGRQPLTGRRVA